MQFVNDSISDNEIISAAFQWPIQSMVSIYKGDSTLTFINGLFPIGFDIHMKNGNTILKAGTGSKSCKCYKDKLTDSVLSYGASYEPAEQTLVLSKRYDLKKGDKIYGYIKTSGGCMYYFPGEGNAYVRQRFDFEGYFEIEFTY